MKKITLIILALATSFYFGFAFKSITTNNSNENIKMKRVTGIGGIFFKCKDPNKMREWYKTHLGLNTNQYGIESSKAFMANRTIVCYGTFKNFLLDFEKETKYIVDLHTINFKFFDNLRSYAFV